MVRRMDLEQLKDKTESTIALGRRTGKEIRLEEMQDHAHFGGQS